MEKVSIIPYREKLQMVSVKKKFFTKDLIMVIVIGFLLGRASILGGLYPFGLALVAVAASFNLFYPMVMASVIAGTYTVLGNMPWQILVAQLLFTSGYIFFKKSIKGKPLGYSALIFLAMFASGIIIHSTKGIILAYDIILLLMEALMASVFFVIFLKGLSPILLKNENDTIVTSEEGISLALLLTITIMGLNNLTVASIHIKTALSILLIFIFSLVGGAGLGASIGIVIGIINTMVNSASMNFIGVIGFSAMIAGFFKEFGKTGVILGYLLGNSIVVLFVLQGPLQLINYREILVAAVLFMGIPTKLVKPYLFTSNPRSLANNKEQAYYSQKFQEVTSLKLKNFSRIFKELSSSFSEISTEVYSEQREINKLIDKIVSKTCEKCNYTKKCWERDFYKTYKEMFKTLQIIEEKGSLTKVDLPKFFLAKCFEPEKLANNINSMYDLYKTNYFWQKRLAESKELVSAQLSGIAQVVDELADEVKMDLVFDTNLEHEILNLLESKGIDALDARIMRGIRGDIEVELTLNPCKGNNLCKKQAEPLVSSMVGTQLKSISDNCSKGESGVCKIKFKKPRPYQIAMGVAKSSKDEVSGDSYSFFETKDGRYVMALSDGMGTGTKAAKESSATLSIVEKLLEAGFDEEVAVKTVNSIMLLKSREENFSTMDLSVVDLSNGKIDFLKIGSVSSFIKRKKEVKAITAGAPPIGILEKVEAKRTTSYLKDGDIILMVTDGITDSRDQEDWILKELSSLSNNNPQEIAEYFIKRASQSYGDRSKDDMTALVAKVWTN